MVQNIETTFNTNTRKNKHIMGESMVKYTGKSWRKNVKFKKRQFSWKHKNVNSNLLKFHFEIIEPSIEFIVNKLQNFNFFGIIKVRNKYVWN